MNIQDQKAIDAVRQATDKLGRKLDPEIIEPVAALNILGVKTTGSCIGHGSSYPWVDIFDPSPEAREQIMKLLPSFHLVQKGQAKFNSFRLVPRQIYSIDTTPLNTNWSREQQELHEFGRVFFLLRR